MATATKREDAAIARDGDDVAANGEHHAVEQSAAVPTVAPASPEAAPLPSKRAAKKSKKKVETAEPEETNQAFAATIDHPYLSFLHKRIRLYRKKLEKIKQLETARASEGKVLNDQQLEVVSNKPLVEKMITEFESLREQFIEVYVKEEAEKAKASELANASGKEEVVEAQEVKEAKAPEEPVAVVAESGDALAYVEDLLRTLHAVTLHQALGEEVPLALDYFSKVLLGTTRPPAEVPFEENLAESLQEATRYLTRSDKTVVLNFTYQDLRAMVEQLGAKSGSEDKAEEENALEEESAAVVPPSAEELPRINFFTDSQLETDAEPVAEDPVTEDKDNQHDTTPEAIEPTVSEEEPVEELPEQEDVTAQAPVAAAPKSFADAAAGKSVWSRKPKPATAPANGSGDEKPNQRRRFQPRSKTNNNNSNSPRGEEGSKNEDASKSNGNGNTFKPRRPRPQRSNDENSAPHNANRAANGGGKTDDRRPRPDRPARKQQPAQSQRPKDTVTA